MQTIRALRDNTVSLSDADRARLYELYQGEIAFADSEIGRFVMALNERGLLDETIVTVVGDHGESFGEHGDFTHGERPWSNEVQVPLVLRYPPTLPAGMVVEAPAQLIDVMPTLLELAGLQAPQPIQGTSLLPFISG